MKRHFNIAQVLNIQNNTNIFRVLFIMVVVTSTLLGQGASLSQKRETNNKVDQNQRSVVHVNPSTLAMEMDLPLMNYPGRGANSLPYGFSYSSKVWRMDAGASYWYQLPLSCTRQYVTQLRPVYAERSAAGWTSSLNVPVIEEKFELYNELGKPYGLGMDEDGFNAFAQSAINSANSGDGNLLYACGTRCGGWVQVCIDGVCDPPTCTGGWWVTYCDDGQSGGGGCEPPGGGNPSPAPMFNVNRVRVRMGDGSTHEFRKSDTIHQGNEEDNLGDFLAVDGSGMRLERTTSGSTLYLPNGGRFIFPATSSEGFDGAALYKASQFVDVNGNTSSFATNIINSTSISNLTDTLGREFINPLPDNFQTQAQHEGRQTISIPGLDGQNAQQYELEWLHLKPVPCDQQNTTNCGSTEGAMENPTQNTFYYTGNTCFGNYYGNLLANPNNINDPANEVLFPMNGLGLRSCNPFTGDTPATAVGTRFNPVVLAEIKLPNGKKYQFKYNQYGEITKVVYPTGAAETFTYGKISPLNGFNGLAYDQTNRGVRTRKVYKAEGSLEQVWNYDAGYYANNSQYKVTTIAPRGDDPNGAGIKTEKYIYSVDPDSDQFGFDNPLAGQPYEERTYDENNVLRSRVLNEYVVKSVSTVTPNNATLAIAKRDVRPLRKISVTIENGTALATLSENEYDENGSSDPAFFSHLNIEKTKGYHFAVIDDLYTAKNGTFAQIASYFSQNALASVSETDYSYDPNYKARGMPSRPIETRVMNPANPTGPPLAKSQIVYDEAAYQDFGYSTTNWVNPNSTLRGNMTTTRTWFAEENRWIETHTQFDNFGNVRKVWDSSNDPTRFVEVEYSPTYHYAYPTKTKAPAPDPSGVHGMTEGSEISRVYDFNTGLLTSVTDANGQTATTEYNDALLRPTRVIPPAGGSVSETVYNDTPGDLWVRRRQQIDEYNWAESTTYFDNLGRAFKSRTKDLQGDVVSEIRYDNFGRLKATSNPYRIDASGDPTESVYWSKPRYDELNRVVETYAPALVDPNSSSHGPSMGTVQFGISTETNLIGAYTVATDASGRKSRLITGIYGLMRVDEATGIGGTVDQDLGTLANPNQPTSYSYNIKGELVKITQGKTGQPTQYRYFAYDSLSRLVRIRQPEQTPNIALATTGNPDNNSWTAGYSYDVFGNVVSMTDAKNTTITNEYDKASRPVKRTYTDGTPQVEFFYDGKGLPQVPQFSRGALTKATSSVSEDRFTSFDNHGRLLASQQITDGNAYDFEYKYNLSGGLTETKYPSGRIVRNFLDTDGGLSLVTTKAANGFTKQVASNFDYSAVGSIKKMKLGNGLWETAQFNERYQLTQVSLGTTNSNNNLFKIDYEYGELNADSTTVDASKNIGIIAKATTTIPATSFVQTFKYDAINRLTEAKEFNPTTPTVNDWRQTFGYDRFGNRTQFSQTVGTTQLPINNITNPTIDASNNRFTTGQGYVYDYNGNLIQDAEGRTFTFDGNDKQIEVRETNAPANQPPIGRYFYDANGARVKKVTNTETTIFVYDAGGTLAAEYSTQTVQNPTTSYLTTDHLGSPRVITDKSGNVISRRDFMPFGEELNAGVGGRTTANKYATSGYDNIRKRFTGYEKDDETNLDFAEARMYQNKHGRFTAPDSLMASANPANPQTFNRYLYTGNNPINYTDPSGLSWCNENGTNNYRYFGGQGSSCPKGWTLSDNKEITVISETFTSKDGSQTAYRGDVIVMNPDGTIRTIRTAPHQSAPEQGLSVTAASQHLASGTAADAASSSAASSGAPQGGVQPLPTAPGPPMLSLCMPDSPCTPSPSAPSGGTLDTSNNEPLKVVEGIARITEACSIATPCAIIAGVTRAGQGDFWGAGGNVLNAIPGLALFRKVDKAADAVKVTEQATQGIYEFVSSTGKVYVGQSSNISARIQQHLASGKLLPQDLGTLKVTEVLGGKTAREVAEQLRIRALGGINKLENVRNPIGKAREYLLQGL